MVSKMTLQRRLAAAVMKIGKTKVWFDPDKEKQKEIQSAITRADVRKLVSRKLIKARVGKLPFPEPKKKKRRGSGSREGSKNARLPKKRRWIAIVRPLRTMLKDLKMSKEIDNPTYRHMRAQVKGGQFRSRSHMRLYLEQHGLIKKPKVKAESQQPKKE